MYKKYNINTNNTVQFEVSFMLTRTNFQVSSVMSCFWYGMEKKERGNSLTEG